ncbi:MAG: hypothetical protein JNM62_00380 [Flavobacteriales bacterium]|nr:hypothetical protein [Flavobacteriales bacterium]
MSLRALSLGLLLAATSLHAQFYAWGWGPEISVTQNGSTITCTTWDPILNQSRTYNQTSVASWSHDDGVVATVSGGGIVTAIVYDINLASFRTEQLTSTSGSSVINIDGVIAWRSGSGIVGAAIYDPDLQMWVDEQFSSNSGNQIQNRDGVVTWVSSSGIVGAAVYDPSIGQWQDEQFSSNSGNVVQNRDGIVAWVSTSGILGAAVYDPSIGQWQDEQFSSSSGNVLVIAQGVVAWKSSSGILGAAAYDWNTNSWDDEQFSSSSSNTMPTIADGTVLWTNSSGQQRYGYTAGGQWQSNVNTAIRCKYYAEQVGNGGAPRIAYLWCLTIGASSYSHNCGDGHTITRRWAWKQYMDPGSYLPQLSALSYTNGTQCTDQLNFVGTAVEGRATSDAPSIIVHNGSIRVIGDVVLGMITIVDAKGSVVYTGSHAANTATITLPVAAGVYALRSGDGQARRFCVVR